MKHLLIGLLLAGALSAPAFAQSGGTIVQPPVPAGVRTTTGALKGNGSGTVGPAACADLSNGATGCSTVVGAYASISANPVSYVLVTSVNLTSSFQDIAIAPQGSTVGWWMAYGTIEMHIPNVVGNSLIECQLWDGTHPPLATAQFTPPTAGAAMIWVWSPSGAQASLAGNLRISCKDYYGATGVYATGSDVTGEPTTVIYAHRIN